MLLMGRNAWRELLMMGLEVSARTGGGQGGATVGCTPGRKGRRVGMGMWRERFLPGSWRSSGDEAKRVLVTRIWQRRRRAEMQWRAAYGGSRVGNAAPGIVSKRATRHGVDLEEAKSETAAAAGAQERSAGGQPEAAARPCEEDVFGGVAGRDDVERVGVEARSVRGASLSSAQAQGGASKWLWWRTGSRARQPS